MEISPLAKETSKRENKKIAKFEGISCVKPVIRQSSRVTKSVLPFKPTDPLRKCKFSKNSICYYNSPEYGHNDRHQRRCDALSWAYIK